MSEQVKGFCVTRNPTYLEQEIKLLSFNFRKRIEVVKTTIVKTNSWKICTKIQNVSHLIGK